MSGRRALTAGLGAVVVVALAACSGSSAAPPAASAPTPAVSPSPTAVAVMYNVMGGGKGSITYSTADGGTSQLTDEPLPFTKAGVPGIRFDAAPGTYLYVSAQNGQYPMPISCSISVNGTVVSQNQSNGAFAIVTCQGRA